MVSFVVYSNANPLTTSYYQAGKRREYKTGDLWVESTACLADSDPAKLQAECNKFCQDALTDLLHAIRDQYSYCYWLG